MNGKNNWLVSKYNKNGGYFSVWNSYLIPTNSQFKGESKIFAIQNIIFCEETTRTAVENRNSSWKTFEIFSDVLITGFL